MVIGSPRGTGISGCADVPAPTHSAQIQADTMAALGEASRRVGESRLVGVGLCFAGGESLLATTNHDLGLESAVGLYRSWRSYVSIDDMSA